MLRKDIISVRIASGFALAGDDCDISLTASPANCEAVKQSGISTVHLFTFA